jgi:hypothetical protein
MLRNVTESQKRRVAGRQRFSCAASVQDYQCPLKGEPFDESGYEIDHIKELRDGGTNDLSNLQALCIMCHRVKTNRTTTVMSSRNIPRIEQPARPAPAPRCHHCNDTPESAKWPGAAAGESRYYCKLHTPISKHPDVAEVLGAVGLPSLNDLYVPRNRALGRR